MMRMLEMKKEDDIKKEDKEDENQVKMITSRTPSELSKIYYLKGILELLFNP